MIGTSLAELVFIRVSIFLLHQSIPLCSSLLALAIGAGSGPAARWTARLSGALLGAEVLFATCIYLPYKISCSRRKAVHPPPLTPPEREALFERCVGNVLDPERYLQLWFLDAPAEEIRRENLREFLLWGFFDRGSDEPAIEDEELDSYISRTEAMLGRTLEPGRGEAKSLRLTLDGVDIQYRSIVWFGIVTIVDVATHCMLAWSGLQYRPPASWRMNSVIFPPRSQLLLSALLSPFTRLFTGRRCQTSASGELGYWYRPHTSRTRRPVVFLHGIGIGLWAYAHFIEEIGSQLGSEVDRDDDDDGQVGIIALEILPVSMRFTTPPLAQPIFIAHLTAILAHHGWIDSGDPDRRPDRPDHGNGRGIVLVCHSYGSVLTTHILRSPALGPQVIATVLIDPVTLLLHLPDVAYNFTRRPPRRANEWQLWFFASTDPGTAHALGRYFFWRENLIWKEELMAREAHAVGALDGDLRGGGGALHKRDQGPRKVAVCMAARDLIVDTHTVAKYLVAEHNLRGLSAEDKARAAQLVTAIGGAGNARELPGGAKGSAVSWQETPLGIEILWFHELDHAQVFDRREDRARVLEIIHRFCVWQSSKPT